MQSRAGGATAVAGRAAGADAAPAVIIERIEVGGALRRAGRWWLDHWLRFAEVVGAQWR